MCDTGKDERVMANKEERLSVLLYNAIVLLIEETFEQYDDSEGWFEMIQNGLDCTAEELETLGIKITIDGGVCEAE